MAKAKQNFRTALFFIFLIAAFIAVINQNKLEHKAFCDAFEEGLSKQYRFGDYSYNVIVIGASPDGVEFSVNGINKIWTGEPISFEFANINVEDIYYGESATGKDTVKFCIWT